MNKIKLHRNDILYPELSYKIIGICFEAQNKLERYLGEKQYGDFIENVCIKNSIFYEREKPIPPSFEGEKERRNFPDFIIERCIVLELKCKLFLTRQDYYQVQRYLNSYNKELGIIVNFRQKFITPRRVLNPNFDESKKIEKLEQEIFKNNLKRYFKNS